MQPAVKRHISVRDANYYSIEVLANRAQQAHLLVLACNCLTRVAAICGGRYMGATHDRRAPGRAGFAYYSRRTCPWLHLLASLILWKRCDVVPATLVGILDVVALLVM